jgi:hypothetical protein
MKARRRVSRPGAIGGAHSIDSTVHEEEVVATNNRDAEPQGMPQPDPALKRLDRLVGTWDMRGHLVGSDDENIVGRTTFQWLDGGFFMQQDVEIDFAGMMRIKSHELIGYDHDTQAFSSFVYSNLSPAPLPYEWDVQGDTLTIAGTTARSMRPSRGRSATMVRASRVAGGPIPERTRP